MTTFLILSLLFFSAGALSILFQRIVPDGKTIRQRFPDRITFTGIVLWLIVIAAGWYISRHTTGFTRVASITTMLFFLLTFETVFLLLIRYIKQNIPAAFAGLAIAGVPFVIQYYYPTFVLINAVIILATMGATTLVMKLNYLRTKVVMLFVVLFTVNDYFMVRFVFPHLNLSPVPTPMRLLIFPTVTYGGHVVGSGDIMFLVLLTMVMVRDHGTRQALWFVFAESVALFLTGLYLIRHDVLLPFLTIMTPVFLSVYLISYVTKNKRTERHGTV